MKCTVLVPKIDRQGIEFPRIPCKVVRVLENGYGGDTVQQRQKERQNQNKKKRD